MRVICAQAGALEMLPAVPYDARPLDLVVVGDANPDLILRGGPLVPAFGQRERIVDHAAFVVGGSGAITAIGAARLGLRTAMVATVGDDTLGRFMREELAAAGVETSALRVVNGLHTGISVILDRSEDRAILTAPGALAAIDPDTVGDALLRRTRHVHISAPFLQPRLRNGLTRLVTRSHGAGATVSLDTGWDPEERWTSVSAALGLVDVLLPNAQEATRLAAALNGTAVNGRAATESAESAAEPDGPTAVAAAKVLAAGGPLVAVKLGADGAAAVRGGTMVQTASYRVDSFDAVGAGDSFAAGFLAGWLNGADLRSALSLGCASAALSTRCAGGTAGQPTRAEAQALMAAGRVEGQS
jgi:sugar/nucleoside kinase (ribokinase family)